MALENTTSLPNLLAMGFMRDDKDIYVSPHFANVDKAIKKESLQMGVMDADQMKKYDSSKYTEFICRTFCHGTEEVLVAAGEEYYWLWSLDDRMDNIGKDLRLSPEKKTKVVLEMVNILQGNPPQEVLDTHSKYMIHYLKRVEQCAMKIYPKRTEFFMKRFQKRLEDYLVVGCLANFDIPTPYEFIKQRIHGSAMYPACSLIELSQGLILSPEVATNPDIERMEDLANLMASLSNDIFSFQKEVLINKCIADNFIGTLMFQKSNPMSFESAATFTVRMITAYREEFWSLYKFIDQFLSSSVSIETAHEVKRYLDGLWEWICGCYDWSLQTGRYCSFDSPFPELRKTNEVPRSKI